MNRIVPFALVVVGLAIVATSFLRPPPSGACLGRRALPAARSALATIERRTSLEAIVHYTDGRDLVVRLSPQRIVSTVPGITEMLDRLGALDRLVGRSPWCDEPATVRALPAVSVQPLSSEELLALEPDLVILDRRLHARDVESVLRRVKHVLLLETSRSLAALGASFDLLSEVLDDGRAREAAREWNERAERLAHAYPVLPLDVAPRVLIVAQWEPLVALGPGALLDDVLRTLGAINVACDLPVDASGTFSEEAVIARAPDWILGPGGEMPARLRATLASTPAVRDERVLPVLGADAFVRGGPRILDAVEMLARHLVVPGRPATDGDGSK